MTGEQSKSDGLAAIDLGSNSFHMLVAREVEGLPRIIDKLRERVALAEGLRDLGQLDGVVQARALATLERFGERVRGLPRRRVRAVGTATFRRLKDGGRFLRLASEALGHPIDILPGREEARLVYLGVAHALGDDEGTRLVVDVGGGSTECILGERFTSKREDSFAMGCVTWTRRFFPAGTLKKKSMEAAVLAGQVQLEPIAELYRHPNWDHAIGSSGTVRAIATIVERQGWSERHITREGLERLSRFLVDHKSIDRVELEGLKPERRPVIAGGVAVLRAVFESFDVETMRPSDGALREGLLHDLVGRITHHDVREESAIGFVERFGIDARHGRRVRTTAEALFDQVASQLGLEEDDRLLLGWSAILHSIGLAVSYTSYHKHGAYLVANADLAGFSRQDRAQLSVLVLAQRRTPRPDLLASLPPERVRIVRSLLTLLRISLRLHRGRLDVPVTVPELDVSGSRLRLRLPDGWLADHPLTRADLAEEARLLGALGVVLEIR